VRYFLIVIINVYQRWVSPRKGFCCAHHVCFGRSTCSVYAKKAIFKHGSFTGVKLLNRRFIACSSAFKSIQDENPKDENPKKKHKEDEKECLFLHGIGEIACCSIASVFG